MKILLRAGRAIFFLAALLASPAIFASPPAGYYLAWSDEFDEASLDTTKWDYWLLGTRRDAVNTSSAVSLNGSNLVITTYTSGGTHYTAMVANDGKFRSRFGYWEASIKWGDTNGMWSAFWMQSPTMGTYLFDPIVSGSELDIVEHRSTDGGSNGDIINQVQNNIHWNGYASAAKSAGSGNIGSGLGSGFHTYGFLWTPSVYTLYVDGSNLRSWNFANNGVPISASTEWTILSSEVDDTSTTWAGQIPPGGYGDLGTSTTKLTVDYVRYYAPTNTLFWIGASGAMDLTNSANYVSNLPPLVTSDLTFSMLSGTNLSPVPGGELAVHSLVFLWMNNGIGIGGTNTLTLGAGGIDMVAANHTVNINCPVNIGANQTWAVGPNSPGNTLLVNGPISGSATLTKASYGTLILNATNGFSGTLNVDTSSTGASGQTLSDGIVRITRSENVASVPTIAIRDNNSAWSTLQLTNLLANLTVPANITLAGRNTNAVAIENLSGSNTLSGNITITSGGTFYLFQSDAGTLNFGGVISAGSTATGTRTFTLQGNGSFYLSGSIQNGSATTVNLAKTNAGTLTIAGASTFSGATTNWRGNLFVNGSLASSLRVVTGTLGGDGVIGGPVTVQPGATLAPGNNSIGALTINNSLTLGGTTIIELNRDAGTNDVIRGLNSVTYGGTLIVTNLAGTPAPGDSFQVFSATTFGGAFATLNLPSLGFGLAWNTNALTNGILSVIATVPPQFSSMAQLEDGNFQFNGTGTAEVSYELDAATNLAPPISWTLVTNAVADQNGQFRFSDLQATNFPQRYYRILSSQ